MKQWETIERIEENLQIEFLGKTKEEATAFISKHLEESKREEEIDTEMAHIQYDEHGFI